MEIGWTLAEDDRVEWTCWRFIGNQYLTSLYHVLMYYTSALEVFCPFAANVFPSFVIPKSLHLWICLTFCQCLIGPIGVKCLILCFEEVNRSIPCAIICEGDPVLVSGWHVNWKGTMHVRDNLVKWFRGMVLASFWKREMVLFFSNAGFADLRDLSPLAHAYSTCHVIC